jgi:hypothetical protein
LPDLRGNGESIGKGAYTATEADASGTRCHPPSGREERL